MNEPNFDDLLKGRLFERRTVFLRGVLDDQAAGDVAAQLMTLDALGDDAVTLVIDATGPSLDAAFTVIDVVDMLGVPVYATCVGRAEGAAVGVLAVCAKRQAGPSARFHLHDPDSTAQGNAEQVARWAEHHQARLHRFHQRLAQATGQPVEHVEADCDGAGRFLDAEQAKAYGLIDEIAGRGAPKLRMGFGPS
jgi:ATP-dependent Clp protease protease subunit